MNKREKIIVACMIVAVLYGAYSFLFDDAPRDATRTAKSEGPPVQEFVVGVIGQIKKAEPSRRDTYLLEQADAALTRNPFYEGQETPGAEAAAKETALEAQAATSALAGAQFSYTGYVEMGDQRIAILNGREFAEGDQINADGLFVKSITPTAVIIGVYGMPDTVTITIAEAE